MWREGNEKRAQPRDATKPLVSPVARGWHLLFRAQFLEIAILSSTLRAAIARSSSLAATNGNCFFQRMSPLAAGVATAGLVSSSSCPSSSQHASSVAAAAPRRAFAAAAAGLRHNHRLALGGIAALSASLRLAAAQTDPFSWGLCVAAPAAALFSGKSVGGIGGVNTCANGGGGGLAAFAAASGNHFVAAAQCSAAASAASASATADADSLSSVSAGGGKSSSSPSLASSAVPLKSAASTGTDGGDDNGDDGDLNFRFNAGAAMLPHPEKVARGGEDAFFVSEDGMTLGVADGVGGWGELGIDAGEYARSLMLNCRDAAAEATAEAMKKKSKSPPIPAASPARRPFVDPKAVLVVGHARTTAQGSATACVLSLDPRTGEISAANLGDSGFIVVSGGGGGSGDGERPAAPSSSPVAGTVAFRSPQQQHGFNFPFQLGAPGSASDSPHDAEEFVVATSTGDVVVVGTDGLFDNVFPDEVARLASLSKERGDEPAVAAEVVAAFARRRAVDGAATTPFAVAAQAMGYNYRGGKLDDITVVVSYIERGGAGKMSKRAGAAPSPSSRL